MSKKNFIIITIIICICVFIAHFFTTSHSIREDATLPISLEKTLAETTPSTFDIEMIINKPEILQCTIQNKGNNPLLVQHISTDCSCVVVDWDKRPIKKDSLFVFSVKIIPNNPGHFFKRVFIFCNTDNSPLFINVKGKVKAR